eukprot:3968321-Amphidinium_carterae.2
MASSLREREYHTQHGDALEFVVFDSDTGTFDDSLGKVRLAPEKVVQGFDGELQLTDAGKGIAAFLRVQVSLSPLGTSPLPAATAQPVQTAPPKKIWVTIVGARGLRDADSMIGTWEKKTYQLPTRAVWSGPPLLLDKTGWSIAD